MNKTAGQDRSSQTGWSASAGWPSWFLPVPRPWGSLCYSPRSNNRARVPGIRAAYLSAPVEDTGISVLERYWCRWTRGRRPHSFHTACTSSYPLPPVFLFHGINFDQSYSWGCYSWTFLPGQGFDCLTISSSLIMVSSESTVRGFSMNL